MTFSVTKSFLSTVVGLMWQKGLIRDVTDPVQDYMPPGRRGALRRAAQLEDHVGAPAAADERLAGHAVGQADGPIGPRADAGRLAESQAERAGHALQVQRRQGERAGAGGTARPRRPLPEFLRDEIMEPIGASSTWRWHGYENSWIDLDGRRVQSMTGGGHWGGGMFISARDMARFGYLFLRNGKWKDRQIVSPKWIEMARTPGPANAATAT